MKKINQNLKSNSKNSTFYFLLSIFSVVILLSTFYFLFSVNSARAIDFGLAIYPPTFELSLRRGESIERVIKIKNQSQNPLPIAVSVKDFSASDEAGGMSFESISDDENISAKSWIAVEPAGFILEAGQAKNLMVKMQVPAGAEPGGHYAVVFFETRLPGHYFQSIDLRSQYEESGIRERVKIFPEMGVLFLLDIESFRLEPKENVLGLESFEIPSQDKIKIDLAKKIGERILSFLNLKTQKALAALSLTDFEFVKSSLAEFWVRIRNDDIRHHRPRGKILIYNTFGNLKYEIPIQAQTILPQKIRKLEARLTMTGPSFLPDFISRNLIFGRYRAQLLIEKPELLQSELIFWVFPWKFWLIVILIGISLTILIARYKTRLKHSLKALLTS